MIRLRHIVSARFGVLLFCGLMLAGPGSGLAAVQGSDFFSSVDRAGDRLDVTLSGEADGYDLSVNGSPHGSAAGGQTVSLAQGDSLSLVLGEIRVSASARISESLVGLDVVLHYPDQQGRGLTISSSVFLPAN